jgi:hypothetical protein
MPRATALVVVQVMQQEKNTARTNDTVVPSASAERSRTKRDDLIGLLAYCALVASFAITVLVIIGLTATRL